MGKKALDTMSKLSDHSRTRRTTTTPWGEAESLRARKLKPGPSQSRPETERNQRERLFAALVATVAERGYEGTTVAHLVDRSGVARSSFYEHFEDKQGCFLAALDAMIGPPLEQLAVESGGMSEADGRGAFGALVESVVAQPAAAEMCLVETYAAGPRATAMLDRLLDALTAALAGVLDREPDRRDLPPEIVRAVVGGAQQIIRARLLRQEEAVLLELTPGIWEWMLCIPPPPGPLSSDRLTLRARPFENRQRAVQPTERVLRAMAAEVSERGYADVTVAEIVERARTSQRTFYESFADKGSALVAAIDSGSAQLLAAVLPAFRAAADWPRAVRSTLEAMFRFAAEEPEYARLGAVEVYAAGRRALEQRARVAETTEELLAPGYALAPHVSPLVAEGIGGAVLALLYDFVKERGPERLLELVPTATYVTLAPYLGAEEAYATALG